jgi:PIN domain nuclease of toxin-antitoxin system
VSRYLLDTNAAIFALADSNRLSTEARQAIATGPNFLSVVSYWEVMIKSMKGSLGLGDPSRWWQDALNELAATPLTLLSRHINEIQWLPLIHTDPFDRVLIAQAISEELELVTTDRDIPRYASERFCVVV